MILLELGNINAHNQKI